MRDRMHAARVVARTQLLESLLSPGLYVSLSAGLIIGWLLCADFARAVDSSGFDPRLSGFWALATRALSGAFGPVFVERLLAEGPFLAILAVSFAPVFLVLSIGSVFRFGLEKNAGAIELIVYGPADGAAYFLGSFIKDAVLLACALGLLTLYFLVLAGAQNLVVGPMFLAAVPVVFFLALAISAFGILCSVAAGHAAAALMLFLGTGTFFTAMAAGSLSAAGSSLRAAAETTSAVLQWFSPLYYASRCARAYGGGNAAEYAAGLALLVVLTGAVLAGSHFLIGRKGVRA
jgi:ABC-type multidrug transport system permease subunit